MKLPQKVSVYLNIITTVALVIFAYKYISYLVGKADFGTVSVKWWSVLASLMLFLAYYFLMSLNWLMSTRLMDKKSKDRQLLVFLASQPYKYLPTSLFVFSSRSIYGNKLGLSLKDASVAQIFENSALLTANFTLFSILYLSTIHFVYGIIVAFLVVAALVYLLRLKKVSFNFKNIKASVDTQLVVNMYALCFFGWLLCGVSFALFSNAIGSSSPNLIIILAANTIAFSLSMLAIFAPGGIGVREFVYNYFAVSKVAILYWRIVVFFIDFAVGIPAILLIRHYAKERSHQS